MNQCGIANWSLNRPLAVGRFPAEELLGLADPHLHGTVVERVTAERADVHRLEVVALQVSWQQCTINK